MLLGQNGSKLHRFQHFLDVWLYVLHDEENTFILGIGLLVIALPKYDVVQFGGENIIGHRRKHSHDADLSDKLLQVDNVIEHAGDELDGVGLAIGFANALHDFAVGTLSQGLLYVEVLLHEGPKICIEGRLL